MYSTEHFIFLLTALPIVLVASFLLRKTKEKTRINIIRISAVLMVIFHLSPVYYNLFNQGNFFPSYYASILWPTFYCNVTLWIVFATFCGPKVLRKLYPIAINFAFIGGLLTILVPQFHTGSLLELNTFRSYMTHTIMLFIAMLAYFSKEYKPNLKDIKTITFGIILYILYGLLTNYLFITYRGFDPNSMYLNSPVFPGTILHGYVVIPAFFAINLLFLILYEHFTLKKEERTIFKLLKNKK